MAEKTPTLVTNNSSLNIQPHRPPSNATSHHRAHFTPRSSTFPDGLDSDSEFDTFEPTPVHSPGGPHYDDLPPSYDEAQQQALQEARSGVPSLDPNDLAVHRMVLGDELPPHIDAQPQRLRTSLLDDPNAYEFEPEIRSGLGHSVPVQQIRNSEQIPVGRVNGNLPAAVNPVTGKIAASALLERALEFTRHKPDADSRYAPRLARYVAVPQEGVPASLHLGHSSTGHHHRRGRSDRGRGPPWARKPQDGRQMPGQWPESASSETLPTNTEEPVQFLRTYAKALHSHSIRPAEFTSFLDGLNALCLATGITPSNLINNKAPKSSLTSVVSEYIDRANKDFFAPRGLTVHIQSLSDLALALNIPEERGQRAAAVATVLDEQSSAEQRALALHPWAEKLESSVPAMSGQMLVLREMGEKFSSQATETAEGLRDEKSGLGSTQEDHLPHSVSNSQQQQGGLGFPPLPLGGLGMGGCGVPGVPGTRAPWENHQGPWGNHQAPWGNHQNPWGNHQGPWSRGGRGWGGPRRGPGGPGFPFARGFGPFGSTSSSRDPNNPNNNWATLGESIGKWGEEFGKSMEKWGEQFGKRAEEWGQDVGRQAQTWGSGISGAGTPDRGQESSAQSNAAAAAAASPEVMTEQETGVDRGDSNISIAAPTPAPYPASSSKAEEKNKRKDEAKHDDSSSSSSDSDSSDSEDDEPDTPTPHDIFLTRLRAINATAASSTAKGKKAPSEIAQERAIAIEKAQAEKTAAELKYEQKKEKRALKHKLRAKEREIKKEHRRVKRELRSLGKEDKDRDAKREDKRTAREKWREEKRAARREKEERRRERKERRRGGCSTGASVLDEERAKDMVWVVVRNLDGM